MTDKELLERAAKAAGIDGEYTPHGICTFFDFEQSDYWNPLTDDGDALRLAVKLGFVVQPYSYYDERRQKPAVATKSGGGMVEDIKGIFPTYKESVKPYDPYSATRRAIVRAAAEIGKEME